MHTPGSPAILSILFYLCVCVCVSRFQCQDKDPFSNLVVRVDLKHIEEIGRENRIAFPLNSFPFLKKKSD